MTDDITWTNEGLDNLQEQCLVIIEVDVTLWVTIEGGAVAPPPEITGAICPNNCHDNGTCVEGEQWLLFVQQSELVISNLVELAKSCEMFKGLRSQGLYTY